MVSVDKSYSMPSGKQSPSKANQSADIKQASSTRQAYAKSAKPNTSETVNYINATLTGKPPKISGTAVNGKDNQNLQPTTVVYITKDADDSEKALNVDEYTEILCTFFKNTTKDAYLGLFGDWGRGKTFLADRVGEKLKNVHNYETVKFNAWEYHETPDIWIHLYETFCKNIRSSGWIKTYITAARASFLKNKVAHLITPLLAIFLIFTPLATKIWWLDYMLSLVGFSGFIFLLQLNSSKSYLIKLKESYGSLTSHREKLGIQEVIGSDLKYILMGIVPQNTFRIKFYKIHIPDSESIQIYIPYSVAIIIPTILFLTIGSYLNEIPIYTTVILTSIICLTALPLGKSPHKDKVLLIIDDIDRCDPQQITSIIESLKLMLEDPEIHDRLQILFLTEEDKLRFSIYKRFEDIITSDSNPSTHKEKLHDKTVNGHIEKLVTLYLRLPPLSDADRQEIINKAMSFLPHGPTDVAPEETPDNLPTDSTLDPHSFSGMLYKKDEIEFTTSISLDTDGWSPRMLRLFLFKYQLGKLIADRLEINLDYKEFASKLKDVINSVDLPKNHSDQDRIIENIINQVH